MNLFLVFLAFIGLTHAQYRFRPIRQVRRPYRLRPYRAFPGYITDKGRLNIKEGNKFEYQSIDENFHEDHHKKYYEELEKLQGIKFHDAINIYQKNKKETFGETKIKEYYNHPFVSNPELFKETEYVDEESHETPSFYAFKYSVNDPTTGDIKSHEESRKGDEVKGFYSLKQPDGSTREVHYTAGKHTGFQAVVTNKGYSKHPTHKEYNEHGIYA